MKARTEIWVKGTLAFLLLGILAAILLFGPLPDPREQPSAVRDRRESVVMAEPTVPPQKQDYGPCTPGDREHPVTWCDPSGPEGKRMYCDETGTARLAEVCDFFCLNVPVGIGGIVALCLSAAEFQDWMEKGKIRVDYY